MFFLFGIHPGLHMCRRQSSRRGRGQGNGMASALHWSKGHPTVCNILHNDSSISHNPANPSHLRCNFPVSITRMVASSYPVVALMSLPLHFILQPLPKTAQSTPSRGYPPVPLPVWSAPPLGSVPSTLLHLFQLCRFLWPHSKNNSILSSRACPEQYQALSRAKYPVNISVGGAGRLMIFSRLAIDVSCLEVATFSFFPSLCTQL